ncbi:expressed protein [Phakopsora pachyrhizi]|uniref:Expressed protein n=1 Tax=Phakopsora pachyrhizi TaxID=170000 RepID=A0AAV0AI08_PHAPC|nr:expressed protein [Phakopsora pachyrhizi]
MLFFYQLLILLSSVKYVLSAVTKPQTFDPIANPTGAPSSNNGIQLDINQSFEASFGIVAKSSSSIESSLSSGNVAIIVQALNDINQAFSHLALLFRYSVKFDETVLTFYANSFALLFFKFQSLLQIIYKSPLIYFYVKGTLASIAIQFQIIFRYFNIIGFNVLGVAQQKGEIDSGTWASVGIQFNFGAGITTFKLDTSA